MDRRFHPPKRPRWRSGSASPRVITEITHQPVVWAKPKEEIAREVNQSAKQLRTARHGAPDAVPYRHIGLTAPDERLGQTAGRFRFRIPGHDPAAFPFPRAAGQLEPVMVPPPTIAAATGADAARRRPGAAAGFEARPGTASPHAGAAGGLPAQVGTNRRGSCTVENLNYPPGAAPSGPAASRRRWRRAWRATHKRIAEHARRPHGERHRRSGTAGYRGRGPDPSPERRITSRRRHVRSGMACRTCWNFHARGAGRAEAGRVVRMRAYWADHHLNELANAGQSDAITRRINGGTTGSADRRARYERAKTALM